MSLKRLTFLDNFKKRYDTNRDFAECFMKPVPFSKPNYQINIRFDERAEAEYFCEMFSGELKKGYIGDEILLSSQVYYEKDNYCISLILSENIFDTNYRYKAIFFKKFDPIINEIKDRKTIQDSFSDK